MNQELVDYIRKQLAAGVKTEVIQKNLLTSGWSQVEIDAAIKYVNPAPATPAPSPRAPIISQNTMISPTGVLTTPRQRKMPLKLILGGGVILLAAAASAAGYAYVQKIGPFAKIPYTKEKLLSGLLESSQKINTYSSKLAVSLNVGPRDAGAVPFTTKISNTEEYKKKYKNDSQRVRDISSLLSTLLYSYSSTFGYAKNYPATIEAVAKNIPSYSFQKISTRDPVSNKFYDYKQIQNGKNFNLTVTFETDDAIREIQKSYGYSATSTIIAGKTVTFTKDSSTYFYLPSEPPKPFLISLGEMLKSIPAEIHADGSISGTTDWSKTVPDIKFNLGATGDFGDLTYKFDIDGIKKDKDFYLKVNNIPSLFLGELSAAKGMWIKIPVSDKDSSNILGYYGSELGDASEKYEKKKTEFFDFLKKLTAIADEEGLIAYTKSPASERVNGRVLYRYDLHFRKEAIVPFYKRMLEEAKKNKDLANSDLFYDSGAVEYLQSPEFSEVFDYIDKNTFLTAWVDPQGFPAILQYAIRVVPPDSASHLKDKQINITFRVEFSDINKPVQIEAPAGAKPLEEISVFSSSVIKSRDARRIADIKQLQLALELYYDAKNQYAPSLDDLAPTYIPTIPKDPTTNNSYRYAGKTSGGKRTSYHLGASLQDTANYALDSDSDATVGFDGSDSKGCSGEVDRACYDVIP